MKTKRTILTTVLLSEIFIYNLLENRLRNNNVSYFRIKNTLRGVPG